PCAGVPASRGSWTRCASPRPGSKVMEQLLGSLPERVTVNQATDVYYDPYDVGINADPYPVFRRLRDDAPLYYNEAHDFYAVSRAEDVERGLSDREHFSNA